MVLMQEEDSVIPNSARVVGTSEEDWPSSHLSLHAAECWCAVGQSVASEPKMFNTLKGRRRDGVHSRWHAVGRRGGNKHGNGAGELEKQRRLGAGKQCDVAVSGEDARVDAEQRGMRGGAGLQMLHDTPRTVLSAPASGFQRRKNHGAIETGEWAGKVKP
ncbi:hypothetical protein C8R44DRAFT_753668 [Mycena epipterygia]|nr:hypothetical protein C8R44DRAFT_753668 [Mycena epipterygia]